MAEMSAGAPVLLIATLCACTFGSNASNAMVPVILSDFINAIFKQCYTYEGTTNCPIKVVTQ
jgi:hypothetical protein